jgi:hypothetical protein
LVSNIMDVRLLHPDTCAEISVSGSSASASAPLSLTLQVPL